MYFIVVSIIEIIKVVVGIGSFSMRLDFKDNLIKCQNTSG